VRILLFGLFAVALITGTTAMLTVPMPTGTVELVTVQTEPTLPDWRLP
jgi:hypothetical protein